MRGKGGVLTSTRLVCRGSIGGINPKVRDLGRSDAGGFFASEQIRKWGENRQNGSFDSNSKICYNCLGFRGRGQRHCTVVSPTSCDTGHESQKANSHKNLTPPAEGEHIDETVRTSPCS